MKRESCRRNYMMRDRAHDTPTLSENAGRSRADRLTLPEIS